MRTENCIDIEITRLQSLSMDLENDNSLSLSDTSRGLSFNANNLQLFIHIVILWLLLLGTWLQSPIWCVLLLPPIPCLPRPPSLSKQAMGETGIQFSPTPWSRFAHTAAPSCTLPLLQFWLVCRRLADRHLSFVWLDNFSISQQLELVSNTIVEIRRRAHDIIKFDFDGRGRMM